MTDAATQCVTVRREGGAVHLTLNRPQSRNALSRAMVSELQTQLAAAEADRGARVLVLRGAGGHFCSGADLKDMAQARVSDAGSLEASRRSLCEISASFGHLCAAFARSPLATIAVLEGMVMGGGLGLACAVDVVLASTTASLRLPETSLGVVPAQIAPYLVERVGYWQARRLAVTGGRLNAEAALALGVAHEVHEPEALDAAVSRLLEQILACAPGAIAATKALMAQGLRQPASALIDSAARAFADAVLGEEGTEGALAFVQKRKPRWAIG